jgi:5'-nucleotidase (lipoprotein e(P4) family)
MYYSAKNWAYQQPTYFAELEALQRHVDWARSLFLITSWMLVVGLGLGAAKSVLAAMFSSSDPEKPSRVEGVAWDRMVALSFGLLGVAILARLSHGHAELQFNERVFGYYQTHLTVDGPPPLPEALRLDAHLWTQTSGEYHAIARQTYRQAQDMLLAIAERPRLGLPLAVVMDIDETVIDNGFYNYTRARRGLGFDERSWDEYLVRDVEEMELVPGAAEFIHAMRDASVMVVFISNRPASRERETWEALERNGIQPGSFGFEMHLATPGESAKSPRRAEVRRRYDVIGWIGDQLSDFPIEDLSSSPHERWTRVCDQEVLNQLGVTWFVLPNPLYGDWSTGLEWTNAPWYYETSDFSATC